MTDHPVLPEDISSHDLEAMRRWCHDNVAGRGTARDADVVSRVIRDVWPEANPTIAAALEDVAVKLEGEMEAGILAHCVRTIARESEKTDAALAAAREDVESLRNGQRRALTKIDTLTAELEEARTNNSRVTWRVIYRVIDNPDELDSLPVDTVILDNDGDAWQRNPSGMWGAARWRTRMLGEVGDTDRITVRAADRICDDDHPVTVLHTPEVSA